MEETQMSEHSPDWATVMTRLQALETRNDSLRRTNRIFKVVSATCLAVIGVLLLTAATADNPGEVKAERFILVDAEGQQYGVMGVSPDGEPGLALMDKKGTVRAALTLVGAPGLTLYDSKGKARAAMEVPSDKPRLRLFDENENTRVAVALSMLTLTDADGTERAHLAVLDNEPHFAFFDAKGKGRVSLDVTGGDPRLRFLDADAKGRLALGIFRGLPGVVLADEYETPRALMAMSKDEPFIELHDDGGASLWKAPEEPAPVGAAVRENKRAWGPEQATGEPDCTSAGDNRSAWASKTTDGQDEWLLLEYQDLVEPAAIKVYETYNPGALYKVSVIDPHGNKEVEVWTGDDPTAVGSGMGVSEIKFATTFKTKRVRLYLKSREVRGWNEIDAVALIDKNGKTQWARSVTASSTYAE
jgi:hypothetical protein